MTPEEMREQAHKQRDEHMLGYIPDEIATACICAGWPKRCTCIAPQPDGMLLSVGKAPQAVPALLRLRSYMADYPWGSLEPGCVHGDLLKMLDVVLSECRRPE